MAPDGRWRHYVRQSDVNRFRQCPELHRRSLHGLLPEVQNDAAAVGTACHAGVELALNAILEGVAADYETCARTAIDLLDVLWFSPYLRQIQIKSHADARYFVAAAFTRWWDTFYVAMTRLNIIAVERTFNVKAYEDEARVIYLAGTADVWTTDGVIDWKFPGDKYGGSNAWKHDRYDLQPTHYLWAYVLAYLDVDPFVGFPYDEPLPSFSYGVTLREKDYAEELEVKRTYGDLYFYAREVMNLCRLIEAELPEWPLAPDDWHCSDKWCPAWDQCRGSYIGPDPWGLTARVKQLTEGHE